MSQVDKALAAWEGRKGVVASRPTRESEPIGEEPVTLGSYAREAEAPAESSVSTDAKPSGGSRPAGERRRTKSYKLDADLRARLVSGDSGSVSLEQYRRLAAVLHDVQLQQGLKTLMLTSALPEEGKTLTTINLALTLSESYERRVLVIDADLRWPSVHKMFGLANATGLSEVLRGALEIPFVPVTPRLSLLLAGRPGETPLAGLTSKRMATLIDECASQFDWVLLDTPPVGLLPDAQPLARLTRAVLFVVAAGVTPAADVERAIAELGADSIIGTVLNRVDERKIPSAGYYYYSRYAEREPQASE